MVCNDLSMSPSTLQHAVVWHIGPREGKVTAHDQKMVRGQRVIVSHVITTFCKGSAIHNALSLTQNSTQYFVSQSCIRIHDGHEHTSHSANHALSQATVVASMWWIKGPLYLAAPRNTNKCCAVQLTERARQLVLRSNHVGTIVRIHMLYLAAPWHKPDQTIKKCVSGQVIQFLDMNGPRPETWEQTRISLDTGPTHGNPKRSKQIHTCNCERRVERYASVNWYLAIFCTILLAYNLLHTTQLRFTFLIRGLTYVIQYFSRSLENTQSMPRWA